MRIFCTYNTINNTYKTHSWTQRIRRTSNLSGRKKAESSYEKRPSPCEKGASGYLRSRSSASPPVPRIDPTMISLFYKYPGGECPKRAEGAAPPAAGFAGLEARPLRGLGFFASGSPKNRAGAVPGPPVPPSLKRCLRPPRTWRKGWVLAMLACKHAARGSGPAQARPCARTIGNLFTASAKAAPKNRHSSPKPKCCNRVQAPAVASERQGPALRPPSGDAS